METQWKIWIAVVGLTLVAMLAFPASAAALIREGDRGPDVREIQEQLYELGFLDSSPDGIFGPGTAQAVESFQRDAQLTADGIVGAKTREALAEAVADPTRHWTDLSSLGLLRRGDRSDAVQTLQEVLQYLNILDAEPNGIFGPQTETAVQSFQRQRGLTADGMVGASTWSALTAAVKGNEPAPQPVAAAPAPVAETPTPATPATATTSDTDYSLPPEALVAIREAEERAARAAAEADFSGYGVLQRGDRGDAVEVLQKALVELDLLSAEPNGVFGPQTENAVRQAQSRFGLTVDGIVGQSTWSALERAVNEKRKQDRAAALPALEGQLRQGDNGDYVMVLQERLQDLGFLQGSADGVFGPATRQAVQGFQRSAGLAVDGVVGADSWNALASARPGQFIPTLVEDMHWNDVQKIFHVGDVVTVEDVDTGVTFRVRRLYGTLHADVEPLTSADTRILREVYGGSWSWERRAVIVQVGEHLLAASINGNPHGGQTITDNGFPGHICMHFRGSRVHASGRTDPDHQEMIQRSAEAEPSSIQPR